LIIPCGAGFTFSRQVHAALAHRAEQLSFRLLEGGEQRTLADYKGRVVVLNFWATWCPPCLAEMPDLERLAQRYSGDGVVVLTVSDETAEKLRAPQPTARVGARIERDMQPSTDVEKLTCQGRPTTLVIDRGGLVRAMLIGGHSLGEFDAAVRRVL
jgi:thiol-disulfide isomerase/thioredoxin